MLKRILNLELISINDSCIVSFTVPLCLRFSTWVVRKIMEFLLFRIWYQNLLVQTLDSNSMWLTSDVNKTRNEVPVANIPSLCIDLLGSFTDENVLILIFSYE